MRHFNSNFVGVGGKTERALHELKELDVQYITVSEPSKWPRIAQTFKCEDVPSRR